MAREVYTDGMHAHAQTLYARRHLWAEGTLMSSGLTFYLFTSSKTNPDDSPKLYHTVRDGSFCSCKGYTYRRTCSHSIAVRRAAEEARAAVTRRPRLEDMMDAHMDDCTRTMSAF